MFGWHLPFVGIRGFVSPILMVEVFERSICLEPHSKPCKPTAFNTNQGLVKMRVGAP